MKYDDIINLPHYQSPRRHHMSMHDRSAQFAPFAALKGYEEEVAETARLTDARIELDENEIALLDQKLQIISSDYLGKTEVAITYFVPDKRKSGGAYIDKVGIIKNIDDMEGKIIFDDNTKIPILDIYSIKI